MQAEFLNLNFPMTIRDLFDDAVVAAPNAVFQRFHNGEQWISRTYAQVQERVIRALSVLRTLNPAVDARIALMLENSPDWQVLYLAIAATGMTVVPIDPKLRAAETAHILNDSGSFCVIASVRLKELLSCAGEVKRIYIDSFAERINAVTSDAFAAATEWYNTHRPSVTTIASLIYTSGTTGRPKGALLTHGNFCANVQGTLARVSFSSDDSFLNVLPLFHAFSFMGNFLVPLACKGSTLFMRSLRTIADDMLELSPSVLFAVPLLAEKLYARIYTNIQKSLVASGLFKFGFSRKLIARKVIERFGGRMRLIGIGGAPTSRETLEGFIKIGLNVLEGYGITECSPGVAYPYLDKYVIGTVGPVLDNIEYKIINRDETGAGELCVKGPSITAGYWNNPNETAAAFDADGFYRTGDIVREDVHKNISICGRTKALIVNREGKNIYPEEIEQVLEHAPLIKDAIVIGYHVGQEVGEHIGAIIVPDEDAVRVHLKRSNLTQDEIMCFIVDYAQGICRASVADYKIPRKFEVRFEPLERTSTLKVRRAVYKGTLDE